MSRRVIAAAAAGFAAAVIAAPTNARADEPEVPAAPVAPAPVPAAPAPATPASPAPAPAASPAPASPASPAPAGDTLDAIAAGSAPGDVGDREIGGAIGVAAGGHTTPGGLRVGGRFLYQMSDTDWFDGAVAFTFGGGTPACFRDRSNAFVCDHGVVDGFGGELALGLRRFLTGKQGFRPYVRAGVAARVVRFRGDDVTGFALPLSAAGGVRVRVSDDVAIGGEAALELGPGWYGHGLGAQLERGLAITATCEFALP